MVKKTSTPTKPSGGVLNNLISHIVKPPCGKRSKKKNTKVLPKNLIKNVVQPQAIWCAPFKAKKMMVAASYYLPKKRKNKPLGEDAHFVSEDAQKLGVADGVGSWGGKGIDAGEYARELMHNASVEIEKPGKIAINPWMALTRAYNATKSEGSSTACILTLEGVEGNVTILHAVNVGDSGFLVIRDGKSVYRSPAQQHRFNVPFQLRKSDRKNSPVAAQVFAVPIQSRDIVVLATDGLFDNLFLNEIEDIVKECLENKKENSVQVMAMALATAARQQSLKSKAITPFTYAAAKEGKRHFAHRGGKYDDVTVIVAQIC